MRVGLNSQQGHVMTQCLVISLPYFFKLNDKLLIRQVAEALDLLHRDSIILDLPIRLIGLLKLANLLVPLYLALDIQTLSDVEQPIRILRLT